MSLITPDFGLMFWMVLIFGIVFFILAKFGFPLITGMVDKRSERIDASIAKAREAEERLSNIAAEQERMLEQARMEQGRIIKETTEVRDKILADAKEQARHEADKILERAKTDIAAERESALRDIRAYVARVSVDVAEKVLRKDLSSDKGQLELIDKLLNELSQSQSNNVN